MLMILVPQSNLESKSMIKSKSKRQGVSPNSMAVGARAGYSFSSRSGREMPSLSISS
jgi:hypothetical protein